MPVGLFIIIAFFFTMCFMEIFLGTIEGESPKDILKYVFITAVIATGFILLYKMRGY